jgi:hypothetical protein
MYNHVLGPESCICPICTRLMRLHRVPALKALDTIEYYFRCDACDYISGALLDVTPHSVCDIPRVRIVGPDGPDLIAQCEHEISNLMQELRAGV